VAFIKGFSKAAKAGRKSMAKWRRNINGYQRERRTSKRAKLIEDERRDWIVAAWAGVDVRGVA